MIIALFILNHKGSIILCKIFSEDMNEASLAIFRAHVINQRENNKSPPVNKIDQCHFVHMTINEGMYIMCILQNYANVTCCMQFMKAMAGLIQNLCSDLSEQSIAKKVSLLTEVIEESCIYGVPQVTDVGTLKHLVLQSGVKKTTKDTQNVPITSQVTGQITWRKPGIRYKQNEILVTVTEKVDLVFSNTGQPITVSVDGTILLKSSLSGMPECRCGVNDRILYGSPSTKTTKDYSSVVTLEDYSFHQCVKLSEFENSHSISFIPPDGKFELMHYRTSQNINIPFTVVPMIRESFPAANSEITLILSSSFKQQLVATNVQVIIPIPSNSSSVTTRQSKGSSKVNISENCIVWKIRKLHGGKELKFTANVSLFESTTTSRVKKESRPPITVKFQVPFLCSGMLVRYLKVFEPKLNYSDKDVLKMVRYRSMEGKYEFRT